MAVGYDPVRAVMMSFRHSRDRQWKRIRRTKLIYSAMHPGNFVKFQQRESAIAILRDTSLKLKAGFCVTSFRPTLPRRGE